MECLARPEVRLTPSPRAKRALWFALLGLHGIVFLLPMAYWTARMELGAIERGSAPAAGRPWARGALVICGVSAVCWLLFGIAVA